MVNTSLSEFLFWQTCHKMAERSGKNNERKYLNTEFESCSFEVNLTDDAKDLDKTDKKTFFRRKWNN